MSLQDADMQPGSLMSAPSVPQVGHIVSPREPVQEKGLYWGYTVRLCNSLSEAISAPCWNEPYDLVVGTSERGSSLTDVVQATMTGDGSNSSAPPLTPFRHALLVFGGLSGLEVAVERDANVHLTADDASELFDAWLNVVEGQGSRTIRTEVSSSCETPSSNAPSDVLPGGTAYCHGSAQAHSGSTWAEVNGHKQTRMLMD